MVTRQDRERRVGRKLFNDGVATEEEHEYTCDRCGRADRTTANYDGMLHSLPLSACGGVFHADMADMRAVRIAKAAPAMLRLCRKMAKTDERASIGRLAGEARAIVDQVDGPAPSAEEERKVPKNLT